MDQAGVVALRRAALVHDLRRVAVDVRIWRAHHERLNGSGDHRGSEQRQTRNGSELRHASNP